MGLGLGSPNPRSGLGLGLGLGLVLRTPTLTRTPGALWRVRPVPLRDRRRGQVARREQGRRARRPDAVPSDLGGGEHLGGVGDHGGSDDHGGGRECRDGVPRGLRQQSASDPLLVAHTECLHGQVVQPGFRIRAVDQPQGQRGRRLGGRPAVRRGQQRGVRGMGCFVGCHANGRAHAPCERGTCPCTI